MKQQFHLRRTVNQFLCGLFVLLLSPLLAARDTAPAPREQIGTVLGEPVYRDQLNAESTRTLIESLQYHFSAVLAEAYLEKHRERLEPSQAEYDAFAGDDPDLQGFQVAQFHIMHTRKRELETRLKAKGVSKKQRKKLELELKHLRDTLELEVAPLIYTLLIFHRMEQDIYRRYGGGRVRVFTMGMEPLEANYRWAKDEELKGRFKITDPKLHALFYQYWSDDFRDGFLMQDPQEIHREFLDPEWQRKARALAPIEAQKP